MFVILILSPKLISGSCHLNMRRSGEFYRRLKREKVVRLAGFEPTTPGSASQCSNPLSYKRVMKLSAISIQEYRRQMALIADDC